jgi:hypothetical protein
MKKIIIAIVAMSSMTLCAQQLKTLAGSIDNRPPVITIKMSSEELNKVDAAQKRFDAAKSELDNATSSLKSIKYDIQQTYNPNNHTDPVVFYTCDDVTYSEGEFIRGYIVYQLNHKIDCTDPPHAVYADKFGNLFYDKWLDNNWNYFTPIIIPTSK